LSIIVVPANENNSTLYIPTLKNFKINRPGGLMLAVIIRLNQVFG
jgi:hypothetical protein